MRFRVSVIYFQAEPRALVVLVLDYGDAELLRVVARELQVVVLLRRQAIVERQLVDRKSTTFKSTIFIEES